MANFFGVNAAHGASDWRDIGIPQVYNADPSIKPVGWYTPRGIFVSHVREDSSGQGTTIQDWKFLGHFRPPTETPAATTYPRLQMSGEAFSANGPAGYEGAYYHVYGLWNPEFGEGGLQSDYGADFAVEGEFADGSPVYAFTRVDAGGFGQYDVIGGSSGFSGKQGWGCTWSFSQPIPENNYFREGSTIRARFSYANSRGAGPGHIYTPWITVGPP